MNTPEENYVSAEPTKDFFITMLVRDIGLIQAITDLVDNCLDGARRLARSDYDGLWVRIEISGTSFKISDNCGGISLDIARKYAFCFGRPHDAPQTPHSVGQFGVGMKRALFKIGESFVVKSQSESDYFEMQVDVESWRQDPNWRFQFSESGAGTPYGEVGTSIKVDALRPGVASEFALDSFATRLKNELEIAHQAAIENKLAISVNGIPLSFKESVLFASETLKPAREEFTINGAAQVINVKIYTGVAESVPGEAGWYVYCNGRAILEADKSAVTGWGEEDDVEIPKFHNQFSRFRGYVFFDCDNAFRLPWNTTKSAVDQDSTAWRPTRQKMLYHMRPVIDFLNKLDREKDSEAEPIYSNSIRSSAKRNLAQLEISLFTPPIASEVQVLPKKRNISYSVLADQAARAMDVISVTTLKEVGEHTFEYFYARECGD